MLDGFVRSSSYPNVFDQTVVQGVLSQVYQVMNNWPKSEEYAKKVLAAYPLTTAEEYANGFNDHLGQILDLGYQTDGGTKYGRLFSFCHVV